MDCMDYFPPSYFTKSSLKLQSLWTCQRILCDEREPGSMLNVEYLRVQSSSTECELIGVDDAWGKYFSSLMSQYR